MCWSCGRVYEEILESVRKRDKNDMEKEFGALKIADGATYIDSTDLTPDEVFEKIKDLVDEKGDKHV